MSSVSVITFTASLPRTLSSSHLRPPRVRAQTEENLRLTFWRSYSGWSKFVKLHVRDFDLSWHVPTNLDETTWLASRLLRGSLSGQSSCLSLNESWFLQCFTEWLILSIIVCVSMKCLYFTKNELSSSLLLAFHKFFEPNWRFALKMDSGPN